MLFTSSTFLFVFLPVVLAVFYAFGFVRLNRRWQIWFLIAASLFFFGYHEPENLKILAVSIVGNYMFAGAIREFLHRKKILRAGIIFNILLLAYFKYTNFILGNLAFIGGGEFEAMHIALPLAISFYTFQQITYLVDTYEEKIESTGFRDYVLYVSFFPQLIVGPIVKYREMMPQFLDTTNFGRFDWEDFKAGYMFVVSGLIKKIVLAAGCGAIANSIYASPDVLEGGQVGFAAAWIGTIAFSFQIYFDFSGYSDIALGLARMLGIKIPINFNSPYRARNVSKFWRRWHITFSRWLSEYLYVPLGGSREGKRRAAVNAFIVFLIGGLWHGAAWTFVLWGLLQGAGLSASKYLERKKITAPAFAATLLTFIFITLTWVVFRSPDLGMAGNIYAGMSGLHGFDMTLPAAFHAHWRMFVIAALMVFFLPNTNIVIPKLQHISSYLSPVPIAIAMACAWAGLALFDLDSVSEFIYFKF